jgi:anoctamin-10
LAGHDAALTQKIFVVNFITSYIPLFLTAFVYMPFGNLLVPYLDIFKITAEKLSSNEKVTIQGFAINPDRLKKQVIYFTVTAQIVNFALETVVPYAKRKVFKKVKEVQSEMAHKNGKPNTTPNDLPEEAAFLSRVRNEAELGVYDVSVDYREMVVQFGELPVLCLLQDPTNLDQDIFHSSLPSGLSRPFRF